MLPSILLDSMQSKLKQPNFIRLRTILYRKFNRTVGNARILYYLAFALVSTGLKI